MALGGGIRSILRNGGLLMGGGWVEMLARLTYIVFMTRYLGAGDYGIWTYVMAAYGLVIGLSTLGLEAQIPIRLNQAPERATQILGTALSLRLATLALTGAGLAGFALWAETDPTLQLALLLTVPALAGRSLITWVRAVFMAMERTAIQVRLSITFRILEVTLGILLMAAGAGLFAVLTLHALSWVTEALLGLRLVRRHKGLSLQWHSDLAWGMLRQGWLLGLAGATTVGLMSLPVLLLRPILNDFATLGPVALAFQGVTIIAATGLPFFAAALPVLSRAVASGDRRARHYAPLSAIAVVLLTGLGTWIG
ncbi:MAG: oligosaccharide flippase family protein, partial [Pseudomonadota bacterium]